MQYSRDKVFVLNVHIDRESTPLFGNKVFGWDRGRSVMSRSVLIDDNVREKIMKKRHSCQFNYSVCLR